MEDIIDFLIKIGKLKRVERKGWVLSGVKSPESIADHTFRMAIMTWVLGDKKKLDLEKIIKTALIHDLCEVYAGDITPYDRILPKSKKKIKKLIKTWPRLSSAEKREAALEKHKKEWRSLVKLISKLPLNLREEIMDLWFDYEERLTREGRFVHQVDRVENLLQALEYWKEDKKIPIIPWWTQMKERIDDPLLLELMERLDKKFHSEKKTAKKKKNG